MAALAIWFVVCTVPGGAVCLAVHPPLRHRPALLGVLAPACTFAVTGLSATVLHAAGIGPWPAVAVVWAGLTVLGGARLRTRTAGATGPPAVPGPAPETARANRAAVVMLVSAVAVGGGIWAVSVHGAVPPNRDSANHAYFVARIVRENTVEPAVVLAASPTDADPVAEYYPLALHTQVAVAHRLTGASVADLLLAGAVLASALWLPLGIFALARRLAPDRAELAGLAALVATSAAVFPYQPMWWGGLTLVSGMCLVPAVLAHTLDATSSTRRSGLWVAALACAGTVLVHTSQLALLVVLFAAFAGQQLLRARRDRRRADAGPGPTGPVVRREPASVGAAGSGPARPVGSAGPGLGAGARRTPAEASTTVGSPMAVVRAWGLLAAACGVLLAPTAAGMVSGTSERADHQASRHDAALTGIERLVTLDLDNGTTQPVLGLLAVAGVVPALRRPRFRPLLAVSALFALVFVASTVGGPLWDLLGPLAVPWYRSWWRLLYNVALFVPLLAAFPLDLVRTALQRRFPGTTATTVTGALCLALLVPDAARTLRVAFDREVLLGPAEMALVEGLDGMLGDDRAVLNQENDGSVWIYTVAGVPAFSGIQGFRRSSDADDRERLLARIGDVATDPAVRRLADRFGVDHVVVNDRTYMSEEALLTSARLRAAGFRPVAHAGTLWVLELPEPASPS